MVLKRTEMFVFGGGTLCTLSPDSSCQQDVLWHDGNSPGVDGTQVSVIKQPNRYASAASWRHSIATD